jgi:hypothetical protein
MNDDDVVRTVSVNGDDVPLTENISKDAKTLAGYDDDELEDLENSEDDYVSEVLASPEFFAERREQERNSPQKSTPSYFPTNTSKRSSPESTLKPLEEVILTGDIQDDAESLSPYPRESVAKYAEQDAYVNRVLNSPEYRSKKRLSASRSTDRSPTRSPIKSAIRSSVSPNLHNDRRHVRFNCVAETEPPVGKWRDQ